MTNQGSHSQSGTPRSGSYQLLQGKAGKMILAERKYAELASKWQKLEAVREADRKFAQEKAERDRDRRDERFSRLLREVTGQDNLAYKTALALREREDHDEQRRRELHEAWDQGVYQPFAQRLHMSLHDPELRAERQRLTGKKDVSFKTPGEKAVIRVNVHGDPVKASLIDHANESDFHGVTCTILGGSYSMPDLHSFGRSRGSIIPLAKSRPVLEPNEWSQTRLQGSMFGQFAQVAEHGPCFRRAQRGGTNAHLPNVSDNVFASGTRKSRTFGPGDVGILRGDTAARGETSNYKNAYGSSSGAPAQDHFTYEAGPRITALEFPLGKKTFPEFH
jgi:hypothetical protein